MKSVFRFLLVLCVALPGLCNRLQAQHISTPNRLGEFYESLKWDHRCDGEERLSTNNPVSTGSERRFFGISPVEIGEKGEDFSKKKNAETSSHLDAILSTTLTCHFLNCGNKISSVAEHFSESSFKRYLIIHVLRI